VGLVDRKLASLRRLERLHRVRRRLHGDGDLEAVIVELEHELGATVSQRIAALFLGISHTALARRVRNGAVPLVENREGRLEVPVPALLRLAAEAPTQIRSTSATPPDVSQPRQGRAGATDRSLAYHRAVADRLNRAQVDDALYRLRKWRTEGKLEAVYADAWQEILRGPLSEVRHALTDDSPLAADLRQNSPFAGVLSEPERRAIIGATA